MSNSTEFGKSLLADVRQRADKQSSDARKRAKKDAWKQLGVEVLIGAGKSLIANRQQEFLNNETNLANKMKIKTANDIATQVSQTESAANVFDGGRDLFFQQKAKSAVDDYLQSQYQAGSYNKAAYDKFSKNLSNSWGKELKKRHNEKYQTTQKFLQATGGGGVESYNEVMKSQRGGDISGFVAEMVGRGTGVLGKDSANAAANMLDTSEQVINFKKTYAKTGDVALSQFVANNKLLEGVELGSPAPTYGEPLKKKNNFGGEDVVIPQLQHDKDGNLIAQTLIKFDTSGGVTMTKPDMAIVERDFSEKLSVAFSKENNPIKAQGGYSLSRLNESQFKQMNDGITARIKATGVENTDKLFSQMYEVAAGRVNAFVGVAINEMSNEGFTPNASGHTANYMVLNSFDTPTNKVLTGAGKHNPWHTLRAMNGAVSESVINIPANVLSTLVTDNSVNLLRSYRSETTAGQSAIDSFVAKNNYFSQLDVHKPLATAHKAIKNIVDNPKRYAGMNDSQALTESLKYISE